MNIVSFGHEYFFGNQSFQCLAIVAFQLKIEYVFLEKFLQFYLQHDKAPIQILAWERDFFTISPTHPDSNQKKKDIKRNRWIFLGHPKWVG